jgi:hypothetical protein
MFKILDVIYLGMSLSTLKKEVEDQEAYTQFSKKIIKGDDSCVWICFPGWNMPVDRALGIGFLPEEGTRIIYQGPMSIIGLSPMQTEESLRKLKVDIEKTLKEEGLEDLPLKIFGFSAGTLASFWLANTMKTSQIITVAPGYRLGEGIFNSLITLEARRKLHEAGWNKVSYDERVAEFNQENNIENLPVGKVMVFAGKHDTYVPYGHSEVLVQKLEEAGKKPLFYSFDHLDHVSIALYLGWLNKRGRDPYELCSKKAA